MPTERERPQRKIWREELKGKHCPVCDLRTTQVRGECLRCKRLQVTRRIGAGMVVAGALLMAGGGVLIVTCSRSDPSASIIGALVAVVGGILTYPGLYAFFFRRWPQDFTLVDDDV